jgi:S-adenosylmethionine:tRNA ribosyltransferase-isomerase
MLQAGLQRTDLLLGPRSVLHSCAGLLTGLHEPGTSHFSLLEAYAPRRLLERAFQHAEQQGYLQHEFGDSCLILQGALSQVLSARTACEWRRAG